VSGKGAEAAAVTALARYTLRAATLEQGPPSQALVTLNTAMLADGSSQFATVVLGYAAAAPGGGLTLHIALGGHPPPLVLRASGEVEALDGYGTVLGVLSATSFVDTRFELRPGDVMLLYTDGVTEAGSRSDPFAESGLRSLLGQLAGEPPQTIVERVEQAVVGAQVGEPRDDIALLALGVTAVD
jgi:serine phosphatase RsbU (regulator of sigma subunit)